MAQLTGFSPAKRFFIGFDSDGCVFDTMEIKQRECFAPVTILKWNLQPVSRWARECHEFVNLYSKWRGINRFPALVRTLELLADRPEAQRRGYRPVDLAPLKEWIGTETSLGNPALKQRVAEDGHPLLRRTLDWSETINQRVAEMVRGVPPFAFAREALERAGRECDLIVVSATPGEALAREWREHGLDRCVQALCGQELGGKDQHLAATCVGRYPPDHTLMVGDSYADLTAARLSRALFYPVLAGREEASWERFVCEAYPRFLAGAYAGDYEAALIAEMERLLPDTPPWKR